ncbi:hypothetical protein MHI24_22120 [Paenibacillus sp. FSL K6-1096]|uniref:hypothetical protein n=1 Tax=Paenibacillus sp. FSL K6-1096 TaxID=2921460 RepID=UPI0030EC70E1
MEPDLEKELKKICIDLSVKLRGNGGGDGNALIDYDLIQYLHTTLDAYKESIHKKEMIPKEIVWSLLYTSSRFYIQSQYSRNRSDLMAEFERLNHKLLYVFDDQDT